MHPLLSISRYYENTMSTHLERKGECYLFCVGFGLLGGILLRLVATAGSWVDLCSSLCRSECEWDWEDCDIFETKDEEEWALAWDIITPYEKINVMAKITAIIELRKEFMVFADLEDVFHLPYMLLAMMSCVHDIYIYIYTNIINMIRVKLTLLFK